MSTTIPHIYANIYSSCVHKYSFYTFYTKNGDKKVEKVREIISTSEKETETVAKELASRLKKGDFLAFYGDLGSGKTAFIRGLAQVYCPGVRVSSPTYAIVNEYRGETNIYHFDMYRITDEDSLYSVGFYDYFDMPGIIAAEWCENIPFALPNEYYEIVFEKLSDTERKIIINKINR